MAVIQHAADRLATATRRVEFVSGWVLHDGEAIRDVLPRALVDDRAAAGEHPDRTVPTSLDLWRGWRNKLRMAVDDIYPPATIDLAAWGLCGEYWVEGIDDDVAESGSFLTIRTDQVRFYSLDAPQNYAHASGGTYKMHSEHVEPLPLEQIPDLVLSEVLRDVDLFVGVASVGNDPTWQDGGPEGRFQHYWNAYAFGDLSHTAQTRKELLASLLPRQASPTSAASTDDSSRSEEYCALTGSTSARETSS